MEKVLVYLMISGDYCAFHEMSFEVVYDITNDKSLGFNSYTKEELDNWEFSDYSDVSKVEAIKDGDKYYVKLR